MIDLVEKIDEIVSVNVFMRMTDLKMSQKSLALLAGLSPVHLNKLIKGKRPISKSTSLNAIAKALHLEEWQLYQDPKTAASAGAYLQAAEHALSDQKRMVRLVSDQLMEALAELKALQAKLPAGPEADLLTLFRAAGPPLREQILATLRAAVDKQKIGAPKQGKRGPQSGA